MAFRYRFNFNVRARLIIVFSIAAIVVTGVMAFYASTTMKNRVMGTVEQKLTGDLRLGEEYINQKYPGEWRIVDGKLYKGEHLIEGDFSIVDEIGKLTGDTATIFRGDTRVSTNVIRDGKRAVGTQVAPEVAEVVLRQGKMFFGEADVAGVKNITAYKPLRDEQGKIIGIWYVGVPVTVYEAAARDFARGMIWFAIAAVLVAIIVSWLLAETVAAPLRKMEEVMAQVSEGDLTVSVRLRHRDEIGRLSRSLNTMIERIADLIAKSMALSENVLASSRQLALSAEQSTKITEGLAQKAQILSSTALEQAEVAERTRTVINEMSTGIQQVADNSQMVAAATETATSTAEEGEGFVKKAIQQMQVINEAVAGMAETVRTLESKSEEIGQIVDVITAIAEQTNLLALNAAIEAARAGEQGRGFAVVADEVRKLAEESERAARQIAQRIQDIQSETSKAVSAMEKSTKEVVDGTEAVAKAGDAFEDIIKAVKEVSRQIQEVSAASQQMAASTDSALQAVDATARMADKTSGEAQEISALTEEQMAGIEELNAAADRLRDMVNELKEAIARFKV